MAHRICSSYKNFDIAIYIQLLISIHSCTVHVKMEAFKRKLDACITSKSRLHFGISGHTS